MYPRSLRHRLEKLAELLVTVQKFSPEIVCMIHEEKGEGGQLVVDYSSLKASLQPMQAPDSYLENRDYGFREKRSPRPGQTTYTGKNSGKSTILLTRPIERDRLAINHERDETPFRFNGK